MHRSCAQAIAIALILSLGVALVAEDAAPGIDPVLQPAVHRDEAVAVEAAADEPDQTAGTLVLELAGTFPLRPAPAFFAAGEVSLHAACLRLRQALTAPEKHLVLDLAGGFYPSLAGAEEMAAILRDRDEGRTVACLLDGIDDAALAVAAACDEVCAPEAGLLLVDGIELSVDYYADALAKLGVRFHAITSGEAKTAAEPFTSNAPSPAAIAERTQLAQGLDRVLVEESRRPALDAEGLLAARALAPQTSAIAKRCGLVDELVEPGAWLADLPAPVRYLGDDREQPDLSNF
ncbi:MAG: S49 family peptidase, partial [Planctomycetes bacterium]|nr:S49 family peptidase [Planctomycetota bacterium]